MHAIPLCPSESRFGGKWWHTVGWLLYGSLQKVRNCHECKYVDWACIEFVEARCAHVSWTTMWTRTAVRIRAAAAVQRCWSADDSAMHATMSKQVDRKASTLRNGLASYLASIHRYNCTTSRVWPPPPLLHNQMCVIYSPSLHYGEECDMSVREHKWLEYIMWHWRHTQNITPIGIGLLKIRTTFLHALGDLVLSVQFSVLILGCGKLIVCAASDLSEYWL